MKIAQQALRADLQLLLVAFIWGSTFVAQRSGMDTMSPLAFNCIRFIIGIFCILPFYLFSRRAQTAGHADDVRANVARVRNPAHSFLTIFHSAVIPSVVTGLLLFGGATLQQWGLVHTTAGNAGFITGIYVVLIPFVQLARKKLKSPRVFFAAFIAFCGLFLITFEPHITIGFGDLLVFLSAIFWTFHIIAISHFGSRINGMGYAIGQYITCVALSLAGSLLFEPGAFAFRHWAPLPLLYSGMLSTGIAFTLQIFAQRHASPTHAAIIMSSEGVFAALAGVLLLAEPVTLRFIGGGALVILGIVLSQTQLHFSRSAKVAKTSTAEPLQ